jgi:hypothetical protein
MGLFDFIKKKNRNYDLLKTFDGREVKYVTRRKDGESVIVGKSGRIAVIGDDIRIICGEKDIFNGNIDATEYYLHLSGDGVTVSGFNTVTGEDDNISAFYKYYRK